MSYQQDPYQDEGLFTVGDVTPQELAYGESAWAVNPYSNLPVREERQPPAFSGNFVRVEAANYGYYNAGTPQPRLMDYLVMEGLGVDFDSEKGHQIMNIFAYHAADRQHTIKANIKAAKLVSEWLTPGELAELKADHKIMIRSKQHKKRTYIIHENPAAKVEIWEGTKLKAAACGVVEESGFVQGDRFLAKVMAIKTDEDDYVKRSYVTKFRD
jgi:hypothetical protein